MASSDFAPTSQHGDSGRRQSPVVISGIQTTSADDLNRHTKQRTKDSRKALERHDPAMVPSRWSGSSNPNPNRERKGACSPFVNMAEGGSERKGQARGAWALGSGLKAPGAGRLLGLGRKRGRAGGGGGGAFAFPGRLCGV
jgi:hypothetical protein